MSDAEARWHAAEHRGLAWARARLPLERRALTTLLGRLARVAKLGLRPRVLDIGCGCGTLLAALAERGIEAAGLDASPEAVATARALAAELGVTMSVARGEAESLPCGDSRFDLVIARSILEHAGDPRHLAAEAHRVLRPAGALFVHTTNALCPRQNEIRGYPCFSWYPGALKRRLMKAARQHHPERIGGTEHPAFHWFTGGRMRRLLTAAGFARVFDRWQAGGPEDLPRRLRLLRFGMPALRRLSPLRALADITREGAWYLALKGGAARG